MKFDDAYREHIEVMIERAHAVEAQSTALSRSERIAQLTGLLTLLESLESAERDLNRATPEWGVLRSSVVEAVALVTERIQISRRRT